MHPSSESNRIGFRRRDVQRECRRRNRQRLSTVQTRQGTQKPAELPTDEHEAPGTVCEQRITNQHTRILSWHVSCSLSVEEVAMLYYALVFLVVGLIAGALGIYGVAGMATQIAWVLFVIGIVLLIIHLITGSRRPVI